MNQPENSACQLSDRELQEKIEGETAPISWLELQVAFARGIIILVSNEIKLSRVAFEISKDNKELVNQWMNEGKLSLVKDEQARHWFENKSEVLATVVKPWVLVQEQ